MLGSVARTTLGKGLDLVVASIFKLHVRLGAGHGGRERTSGSPSKETTDDGIDDDLEFLLRRSWLQWRRMWPVLQPGLLRLSIRRAIDGESTGQAVMAAGCSLEHPVVTSGSQRRHSVTKVSRIREASCTAEITASHSGRRI